MNKSAKLIREQLETAAQIVRAKLKAARENRQHNQPVVIGRIG